MIATKKTFQVEVDERLCHVCGACVGICPFGSLELSGDRLVVKQENCRECRWCLQICPFHALIPRPVAAEAAR